MTGRKADVPADETKIRAVAVMPTTNVGYAIAWYPKSKSPVGGAAAGRSRVVTPTTTMNTAT
jgi:hypothetical protein